MNLYIFNTLKSVTQSYVEQSVKLMVDTQTFIEWINERENP